MQVYLGDGHWNKTHPIQRCLINEDISKLVVCRQIEGTLLPEYPGEDISNLRKYSLGVIEYPDYMSKFIMVDIREMKKKNKEHVEFDMPEEKFEELFVAAKESERLEVIEGILDKIYWIDNFDIFDPIKDLLSANKVMQELQDIVSNRRKRVYVRQSKSIVKTEIQARGHLFTEYFPEYITFLERKYDDICGDF